MKNDIRLDAYVGQGEKSALMRNQTSDLRIPRSDTTAEVHKLNDEPRFTHGMRPVYCWDQ